jgi:hypothetical protein
VLARQRKQVISVEKLIELPWPLGPPKLPRDTLQVHVGRLRQVLEPGRRSRSGSDRLRTESGGYRLRFDPGELDAEEFQDLARLGQRALAAGDAAHARQLLADGLDLWRGSDDAAALLRLLAVTPAGDVPAWFAAAVLYRPLVGVEAAVEELIDSRLLDPGQTGQTWAGERHGDQATHLLNTAAHLAQEIGVAGDRAGRPLHPSWGQHPGVGRHFG